MPIEYRNIVFSPAEFLDALIAHNRMIDQQVLPGRVVAFEFDDRLEIRATCEIRGGNVTRQAEVRIAHDVVTEALIRFCIENNIPIPREGRKKLQIVDDKIALNIYLKI